MDKNLQTADKFSPPREKTVDWRDSIKVTTATDYDWDAMAERAGFEPAAIDNNRLTTRGQNGSNTGQILNNVGQALGFRFGPNVEERTDPGQPGSNGGRVFAPKWPPRTSGLETISIPERYSSELEEIVDSWEELPQPLKEGILAFVRGGPQ